MTVYQQTEPFCNCDCEASSTISIYSGLVFLGLLIVVANLERLSKIHHAAKNTASVVLSVLPVLSLALAIWLTVGISHLRRFHRWFAVVFFLLWTTSLIFHFPELLRSPNAKLLPLIVLFSVVFTLNLFSACYLSRRSFREFAVQFVIDYDKDPVSTAKSS